MDQEPEQPGAGSGAPARRHELLEWVGDQRLLTQALTHSSYANEHEAAGGGAVGHNERLEFLGDAVLQLVVTEVLYREHPEWPEGQLTQARAGIVCAPTLARAARRMGLGRLLRLGRGEERSGGRDKPSLLADALEAVIGAVYLAQGLDRARAFVHAQLGFAWQPQALAAAGRDYKTELAERLRAQGRGEPQYHLLRALGPDHAKVFEVGLTVDGQQWVTAQGHSKKEAEQACARLALARLDEGGDQPRPAAMASDPAAPP